MPKEIEQLIEQIESMNDDGDTQALYDAMEFYCSEWDKRRGFQRALVECLQDQYGNHASEQTADDLARLKSYLKI